MVNNPDNGSHAMHEKEKRIIIVVRCVFTLQGLSALCHSAHWRVQAITPEAFDAYTVLNDQRPDLLIIESECFDEQRSQALTVMNVLPHKTIVLTNSYSGGLCKVPSAGGTTIMVDKSGSVMALKSLLQRTANERHSVQPGPCRVRHHRARMAEREVLRPLLNGDSPDAVAERMGITYSAVSRYKMSALRRAGVRTLNEIVIGNYKGLLTA